MAQGFPASANALNRLQSPRKCPLLAAKTTTEAGSPDPDQGRAFRRRVSMMHQPESIR
jgi:hypothetical protein